MQNLSHFFQLGWQFILDWRHYEHILFVITLCSIYNFSEWKKVFILITIFTLGHSLTLSLGLFGYIPVHIPYISFLIPLTILFTAVLNFSNKKPKRKNGYTRYWIALFFGLLHGLWTLMNMKEALGIYKEKAAELLAFNIGIECAQLVIASGLLIFSFFLIWMVKVKRWDWIFFISSAAFGIALVLAAERLPAIF